MAWARGGIASVAVAGVAAMALAVPAGALTCDGRLTAVESVICGDEDAANADVRLNDLYWTTLRALKAKDQARHDRMISEQRDWLVRRETTCASLGQEYRDGCVVGMTDARAADLRAANLDLRDVEGNRARSGH